MKILVLSAMQVEYESMEKALRDDGYHEYRVPGVYIKDNYEVHLHQIGIGKVNAAIGAFSGIVNVHPDFVVSQGCCAGVQGLSVGDVIFVDKSYEYDFNLEPIGYVKGEIPLLGDRVYGFKSFSGSCCCSTQKGIMMTADKFCLDDRELKEFFTLDDLVGADMETGAIAHVCYLTGDKFVGIRAVSDVINSSSQAEDYARNEVLACSNAAKAVVRWINCLSCTNG